MSTFPSAGPILLDLRPGQTVFGFDILRISPLPELRCIACEARHRRTGARLLHLVADDAENLFAISFRTPPPDDTGVAHILEHSVLGGSRRFPVKDPFVEMLKSSMATFINAFTYPDRTIYPVASNVRKDYFNLVGVYLDAVFHPSIRPETLKQEGSHLELAERGNPKSPLILRGVVYNEMKGVYSDLDNILNRESSRLLFPASPYGLDSGGDPEVIPTLTYEAFTGFYRRFYSPANARIVLYGDIPTREQLEFLDAHLRECETVEQADSSIGMQPRWTAPREAEILYPVTSDEGLTRKTAITMSWLIGALPDPILELGVAVLDIVLLGHAAAPLRKALVESRLGEDLTGSGYSTGSLEGTFHVGLKGTDPERKDDLHALVFRILEGLATTGIPEEEIEIAFNQLQYSHREIQSMYPLHLMDAALSAWNFDHDPLTYLRFEGLMDGLYKRYQACPSFFTELLRTQLIDNPHRVTVTCRPDPELQERQDRRLQERLEQMKKSFAPEELDRLDAEAVALEELQSAPNSPEALATLPRLHITDLSAEPKVIPCSVVHLSRQVPLVQCDVFANGVNYLILAFDLSGMPPELLEYVPVFSSLFSKLGAGAESYVQTARRMAKKTGGLRASTFLSTDAQDAGQLLNYLTVSIKALDSTYVEALGLVRDLLLGLNLNEADRLRDVTVQRKVQLQSNLIPEGHRFAALHAARTLSSAAYLGDLWGGIPQLRLADRLAREVRGDVGPFCTKLEAVHKSLVRGSRMAACFTGSDALREPTTQWMDSLIRELGLGSGRPATSSPIAVPPGRALAEGLVAAADVGYCALCMPAPHASHPDAPLLSVFCQLLTFDYLWQEVRVKEGAYGGFASYDALAQVFEFLSYRDPAIRGTLNVYANVIDYARTGKWTEDDVERAVMACAKADEKPIRPGAATATALWRQLGHVTEELRRQRRADLLRARPETVRAAAVRLLEEGLPQGNTCVLGNQAKLEEANRGAVRPLALENVFPSTPD
ncbi:MAG: hypothetical protein A3K19_07165 [Lentisphaerae bacterium RIFOXYB12_FULL_65_16]|nr:MAG: hypothetical protein A3K18_07035 [Lentisphaerae bacterium RIFOXYA12_64_32]OGV93302.1 MAG: hypothetical protein A3K19_07165 [Lentisphaerae bacterium RIFOXYB12_FULL_65_16]